MKTAKQSKLSSGVSLSAGASYSSVLQEVGVVYTNPVCTKEMSLVAPLQSLTHLPFLSSFSPLRVSLLHCPSPPLAPFISSPSLLLPFFHSSPFLPFCSFPLPLPLPCADQGEGSEQREKWVPAR